MKNESKFGLKDLYRARSTYRKIEADLTLHWIPVKYHQEHGVEPMYEYRKMLRSVLRFHFLQGLVSLALLCLALIVLLVLNKHSGRVTFHFVEVIAITCLGIAFNSAWLRLVDNFVDNNWTSKRFMDDIRNLPGGNIEWLRGSGDEIGTVPRHVLTWCKNEMIGHAKWVKEGQAANLVKYDIDKRKEILKDVFWKYKRGGVFVQHDNHDIVYQWADQRAAELRAQNKVAEELCKGLVAKSSDTHAVCNEP